jgi:hypothetical protein
MKHLILVLGLVTIPTKQENLPHSPQPLAPYIQTSIPVDRLPQTLKLSQINTLVDALILVESSGNPNAYNKKERACGCLQIRPIMLREVNRILSKQKSDRKFLLEDRWECGLSKEMFYIWVNHHHKDSSDEVIARCWNGGPRGWKKPQTEHYWNKVQKLWEK